MGLSAHGTEEVDAYVRSVTTRRLTFTQCDMASKYERSLRNPLSRPLVGVPTFTPIDTKKVSFRCAAVVDTANSGETKILWMPHAGCVNDVDAFRVVNGTVSVGTNRTNSPFTASRIGDSLRARLVSARMTVCGVSAENDGIIVGGASVIDDASQYTVADIVSRITQKHLAVGRTAFDMVHLNYVPRDADEREAFVDDVNEGVFGGARTITSTAYPARHVVAWKGEGGSDTQLVHAWNDSSVYDGTVYYSGSLSAWPDVTLGLDYGTSSNGNAGSSVYDKKWYCTNDVVNQQVCFSPTVTITWQQVYDNSSAYTVRYGLVPKQVLFYVKYVGSTVETLVTTVNVSQSDINAVAPHLTVSNSIDTVLTRFMLHPLVNVPVQYVRVYANQWWTGNSSYYHTNEDLSVAPTSAFVDGSISVTNTVIQPQQLQVMIDSNWELIGDDVENIRETTTPALVRPVRQSTLKDVFVSPLNVSKGGRKRVDDSAFAPRRRFVDTPGEM